MRGVPLKPGEHSAWSKEHLKACRECKDRSNARDRARYAAGGTTARGPYRTRETQEAAGELYGPALRHAVFRHLLAYPVSGLTALEIARALRMRDPEGGGQIRVRGTLRTLEAGGQAGYRTEPRSDGSARTCRRWYPAAVLEAGLGSKSTRETK